MIIEIHMIQNHSPANLNRDDLGAPKTCIFGGVTRARISSQCLKRSIRRSPEFAAALENGGGVRTRRLIEEIAKAAAGGGQPSDDHKKAIYKVFKEGGVTFPDNNEEEFKALWFLPKAAIEELGTCVKDGGNLGDPFANVIAKFVGKDAVHVPDIALCGRMTEFDAKGPLADLKGKFTVEAALSAAHAISTHAVVNEVDYFTASDDVSGKDAGGAYLDEAMFNSACFYKHFAIDWEQLQKNLGGDIDLAGLTVKCFLEGAAKANPSGKQHSFAAFNFPDAILVEVKQNNTPVSYANAFADPVTERSERGLIGESVAKLASYANDLIAGYGLRATRFFFSPNGRIKLGDAADAVGPSIEDATPEGDFNKFVDAVMKAVKSPAEAN
ncbi:MAG: type I-E CRISPR-associated protein Cas7/Cse4/CasC [Planctomycetes bacterium]|nr:type I-E CRISPR-associated protein Cas7/Cse4/CasC [Planctomycetota bacterium]MCW8134422.1 type I-E CRISPR-associated protein Cas7/Cse4/CasC [Planctomycetota bacterium]